MENLLKYLESNEVLSIKEVIELKKEINIDFADQANKFRIKVLYKAICKKILPHLYGLRDNDSKYICQNIMEHYLFNKKDVFSKSILEEILLLELDYLELKQTVYSWVTENNNYPIEPWKLDEFLKTYSINYYQKFKKYEEFEKIKASSLEMEKELEEEKDRKRLEKEKRKKESKDNIKRSIKSGANRLKDYKDKVKSDIDKLKELKNKEDNRSNKYLPDAIAKSDDTFLDSDREVKDSLQDKRVARRLVDNFIIGELKEVSSTTTAVLEIEDDHLKDQNNLELSTSVIENSNIYLNGVSNELDKDNEIMHIPNILTKEAEFKKQGVKTFFANRENRLPAITLAIYLALLAIPKEQYTAAVIESPVLDLNIYEYDTLSNDLSVIVKNVIAHRNPEIPLDFRYRFINKAKLSEYLQTRNSLLAEEPYISIIINTAKSHDLNPNILFALAGQEQGFVPKDNKYANKIINNPYNVFTSWKKYNTDLEDSSNIACRTIKNLVKERPLGENPFKWINRKYAQDKNWWKGINSLFVKLEGLQN